MLNLIKNKMKDFNGVHSELFENNNYSRYEKFLNIFDKDTNCGLLADCENLYSEILFNLSGKIYIKVEKDLSLDLLNTEISSILLEDFKYLPFNYFQIDTENIEKVNKVYISKQNGKIYFHFEGVGVNNLSIQFVLSNKGIFAHYTYSSLYYHKEIQPIDRELQSICENCLKYTVSVIFYLINFQNNKEKVIKDINHENFLKKLSAKQLSKPKIQKKLKYKSDTVILKFDKNSTSYQSKINIGNKRVSTKFLVKGHWRNQRIGKREEYNTTKIWIKPHFKGANNQDYKNKVYKVS